MPRSPTGYIGPMDTRELREAHDAMILARAELDSYHENGAPNPIEFELLYQAVQATTAEYVRLLRSRIEEKYGGVAYQTKEGNACP